MNLLEAADPTAAIREESLLKWKDKSAEDLLKKAVEADIHIKNLERENAEKHQMYTQVYDELQTKAKLEDLLDRMQNQPPVALPLANEVKQPEVDMNKMKDFFKEEISSYEKQKREVENFGLVQSKLKERYGDNYAHVLTDQYNQLGLSNEDMNSLATKSPEAYFRMLGLNDRPRENYQTPPRTNQRNDSFAPKVQKRDWWYYQEMRKTNPKLYLDPKISAQMERDAQELGAAFGMPSD